jgi:hypothetical protein
MYTSDSANAIDVQAQFIGKFIRGVRAAIAKAAAPVIRTITRMVGRVTGR